MCKMILYQVVGVWFHHADLNSIHICKSSQIAFSCVLYYLYSLFYIIYLYIKIWKQIPAIYNSQKSALINLMVQSKILIDIHCNICFSHGLYRKCLELVFCCLSPKCLFECDSKLTSSFVIDMNEHIQQSLGKLLLNQININLSSSLYSEYEYLTIYIKRWYLFITIIPIALEYSCGDTL